MKLLSILLVLGVVAVYFYLQNVDRSGQDMEARARIVIPTLAATVLVLTMYIAVTAF